MTREDLFFVGVGAIHEFPLPFIGVFNPLLEDCVGVLDHLIGEDKFFLTLLFLNKPEAITIVGKEFFKIRHHFVSFLKHLDLNG